MHRKARRARTSSGGPRPPSLSFALTIPPHHLAAAFCKPPSPCKWYPAAKMAKRVVFLLAAALLIAGELFTCGWSRCLQAAVAPVAPRSPSASSGALTSRLRPQSAVQLMRDAPQQGADPAAAPWLGRRPPPDRAGPRSARRHRVCLQLTLCQLHSFCAGAWAAKPIKRTCQGGQMEVGGCYQVRRGRDTPLTRVAPAVSAAALLSSYNPFGAQPSASTAAVLACFQLTGCFARCPPRLLHAVPEQEHLQDLLVARRRAWLWREQQQQGRQQGWLVSVGLR